MQRDFKLLDTIALIEDITDKNLKIGNVGVIVEILDDSTYLVEFSGKNGESLDFIELKEHQMLKLIYEVQHEFA